MTNIVWFLILFLAALFEAVLGGKFLLPFLVLVLAYLQGEKIFIAAFWSGLFLDFLLMDHLGKWALINLTIVFLVVFLRENFGEKKGGGRLRLPE
ncbi:MAG: hypothetical protein ACOX5S_02085 [Patescibacteria group bacterium]|jgi:cell shape-determining protein MreD